MDGTVDNNGMVHGNVWKKWTDKLKFKVDLDALFGTSYYHRLISQYAVGAEYKGTFKRRM